MEEEARLRQMVRQEVARALNAIATTGRQPADEAVLDKDVEIPAETEEWLFIEIWKENREFFKEFVTHSVFLVLFVLGLDLFHRYIQHTSLVPEDKEALDKFHFYGTAVAVVIFGVSFVIGAIRNRFWKKKKK